MEAHCLRGIWNQHDFSEFRIKRYRFYFRPPLLTTEKLIPTTPTKNSGMSSRPLTPDSPTPWARTGREYRSKLSNGAYLKLEKGDRNIDCEDFLRSSRNGTSDLLRTEGSTQLREEDEIVSFSKLGRKCLSIYDVLNEFPFLRPALRPFILGGKNMTNARELFRTVGMFLQDVYNEQSISQREKTFERKVEQGDSDEMIERLSLLEREKADSDEVIDRLCTFIAKISQDRREMSRELEFFKCRTRELEDAQRMSLPVPRQVFRRSRPQFEEDENVVLRPQGRHVRRRLSDSS